MTSTQDLGQLRGIFKEERQLKAFSGDLGPSLLPVSV